jgi:hypothetical protein
MDKKHFFKVFAVSVLGGLVTGLGLLALSWAFLLASGSV